MTIKMEIHDGKRIAAIESAEKAITDAQSALELLISAQYEAGSKNIVVAKEAVADDFFVLSTGIAGEILQKIVDYQGRIAIYGDFSGYTSKPLRDFIYESNNGSTVFFAPTKEEAVALLTAHMQE